MKTSTKISSAIGIIATVGSLAFGLVSPEAIKQVLGDAMEYQVTSFTIAFILAWKIVKRDMKKDNEGLTAAVNGVKKELHSLNETNSKRFIEQDDKIAQLEIEIAQIKQAKA